jgi:hypothetical protein
MDAVLVLAGARWAGSPCPGPGWRPAAADVGYGLALPLCLAPCLGEAGLHGATVAATVFLRGAWLFTLGGTTAQAAPLIGGLGLAFFPCLLLVINQRQLRDQVQMQRTGRPRGMLPANLAHGGRDCPVHCPGEYRTLWAWLEAAVAWVAGPWRRCRPSLRGR